MNAILVITVVLSLSTINCSCKVIYVTPAEEHTCPNNTQQCYTLSTITRNPTNYFRSNTRIVFTRGNHTIDTTQSVIIENVSNITLEGMGSTIQCIKGREIGFVFMEITNLSIANLRFYHCGTPLPEEVESKIYSITDLSQLLLHSRAFYTKSSPTLYLIQVTDVTIFEVRIYNSTGPGLLGFNVIGKSIITQSSFISSNPNCAFLFMDTFSNTAVLSIYHSEVMFGRSEQKHDTNSSLTAAAGLSVIAAKTTYAIAVWISNTSVEANNGTEYGNMLFRVEERKHFVEIHLHGIKCSHSNKSGLALDLLRFVHSETWAPEKTYVMTIAQSYFGQNTEAVLVRRKFVVSSQSDGIVWLENVTFHDNTLALWLYNMYVVVNNVTFTNNIAETEEINAPIKMDNCKVKVKGNTTFTKNKGKAAAVLIRDSSVSFQGNTVFLRNQGETAGAIYAKSSQLHLHDNMQFEENEGYDGGALSLNEQYSINTGPKKSYYSLNIAENLNASFTRNRARHYGGAIYVGKIERYILESNELLNKIQRQKCFYTPIYNEDSGFAKTGLMVFTNNTSDIAGNVLYGGWIELCYIQLQEGLSRYFWERHLGYTIFNRIFQIETNDSDLSPVSSEPVRVCICYNMKPECNITYDTITAYPGETFQIYVVGVGQMYGTVPSSINARFRQTNTTIQPQFDILEHVQKVERFCTYVRYTVFSPNMVEDIILTAESNFNRDVLDNSLQNIHTQKQFADVVIHVELQPCPIGFIKDKTFCACHPHLQALDIQCNLTTATILRESQLWINATFSKEGAVGILVHQNCPFGYCKAHNLDLSLENPDEQCALNRSGTLCGACQHNLSHVLGSSQCKRCSSFWSIALVAAAAVAGLILVVFLILLNFTVSEGTISGLIFYANIVQANQAIFFPNDTKNTFFSWFIAWLNLDLGIETCFYNGMDAYAKTWLQFIFPIYVWFIVILIIISSHYSITAAKLAGRNAIKVLATLFLLSYAKMLRVTITIISSTTLEYPDGSVRRVWLYDGNVDYLKGKHIPLFMAAVLVLLVLSLPYTALLLFVQCLQLKSKYRTLFWIGKFKPLFDAYTGPYKDKYRYWTGFLLLIRATLFLIFSVNVFGNPAINLLVIVVTVFFLFIKTALTNGIHRIQYLNILEYTFIFNLGALSATSLYTRLTKGSQTATTYISVTIAFVTFCGIVIYHAIIRILSYQNQYPRIGQTLISRYRRQDCTSPSVDADPPMPKQVSVTYTELREPVMEYCDM